MRTTENYFLLDLGDLRGHEVTLFDRFFFSGLMETIDFWPKPNTIRERFEECVKSGNYKGTVVTMVNYSAIRISYCWELRKLY